MGINEPALREKIIKLNGRIVELETENKTLTEKVIALEEEQTPKGDDNCDHHWGAVDYTCTKCGMLKSRVIQTLGNDTK